MVKDNYKKYQQLRNEYNFFIYEGYTINDSNEKVFVTFRFNLADKYFFYPTLEFIKGKFFANNLSATELENFIFHIGMVELISYWKAACPPNIIIKPFNLNDEQIAWWKNLWFKGLGEFFYLNNIKPSIDDFVIVTCQSENRINLTELKLDNEKIMIPVGGGKDSAVTLEVLKSHFNCIPFIINPRKASLGTVLAAGFGKDDFMEVKRTIHPQLLKLNDLGFLNGHTPFSALLAFLSVFAAAMCGVRSIALSNESSANEPTDSETGVNHQYSKSFEFEGDFRYYMENYISREINYFSFLRPVSEYSIAGMFSKYSHYFKIFRSCNAGSKNDTWCCNCPKCLFTFIILSPHLSMKKVVEIFGKDLLDEKKLKHYFDELTGISEIKPFECVGTLDEVNYSLVRTIEKRGENLPYLLKYYLSTPYYYRYRDITKEEITLVEKKAHFLEDGFMKILRKALHGS